MSATEWRYHLLDVATPRVVTGPSVCLEEMHTGGEMSERSHRPFTSRRNDHCRLQLRPTGGRDKNHTERFLVGVVGMDDARTFATHWSEQSVRKMDELAKRLICIDDEACSVAQH